MGLGTFLNGTSPSQLRGAAWLALSDTGQRGTASVSSDAGGGGVEVWTYAGSIPCRVDPLAGDERITASKLSDRSTHLITAPAGTAMSVDERFLITGGTFAVTAVRSRTADPLTFFEAVQVF